MLTQRAEAALAPGRSGEAIDLAHLALGSDPRFADAYIVVGKVQRDARTARPSRATRSASISSWPRSARTPKRRATRWPPCRRDPTAGRDRLSLAELRARYVDGGRPLPASIEAALAADPRAGARAILDAVARRRRDNRAEGQRLRTMLRFETALWRRGVTRIAGVDEAGMSPLAGPVAAAAVILAPGTRIAEVDDSKRLDAEHARAAGADHQASRPSPGRWRSPRSRRSIASTSTGRAWRPCGAPIAGAGAAPPSTC